MDTLWTFLNSPLGITIVAGLVGLALTAAYKRLPKLQAVAQKYSGHLKSAVKYAEAKIPDGTKDAGLKRLDMALKFMLDIYKAREGKPASDSVKAGLVNAINDVHADLERFGQAGSPSGHKLLAALAPAKLDSVNRRGGRVTQGTDNSDPTGVAEQGVADANEHAGQHAED